MAELENILSRKIAYAKCPLCGVNQSWNWKIWSYDGSGNDSTKLLYVVNNSNDNKIVLTQCNHCIQDFIFYKDEMIYPMVSIDITENIYLKNYPKSQTLFKESCLVGRLSPRAAMTLSRMCLENLVSEILQKENLPISQFNANIETLHKNELISTKIKDRLNDIRTIGNKSTHNFNIIDTDNDVTIEDCIFIWKIINTILEFIRVNHQTDEELPNLRNKVESK